MTNEKTYESDTERLNGISLGIERKKPIKSIKQRSHLQTIEITNMQCKQEIMKDLGLSIMMI